MKEAKIVKKTRYDCKLCHNPVVAVTAITLFSVYLFVQIKLSAITNQALQDYILPHKVTPHVSRISCDRSHEIYDICSIDGPVVLDPMLSTIYEVIPTSPSPLTEKIRPRPHKKSLAAMSGIKEVTIKSGTPSPRCKVYHNAPALVFSAGGPNWNFFHAIIDGFIPLFITVNTIFPDQDLILVITEAQDWWISKYSALIRSFSKHLIINVKNETSTHCFPSASVGLISHGYMTVDPKRLPNSKTIKHFHALFKKTYCHGNLQTIPASSKPRPRLVLLSRSGGVGRVIVNQAEVIKAAREESFDVVEFEPKLETTLEEACALITSSQVVLGVHGAALTNAVFLKPHSVLIQVVGLGLEEVAELTFGNFANGMEFEYIEYTIGVEESTLVDRYGKDDVIVKNPKALQEKGWSDEIMEVYLRQQNVNLDLVRLKRYLKRAYKCAKRIVDEG